MVSGWKTKKLGEVAEVCMCKRIFAHQTSKIGTIPFYKIGTFGKEADAYISSQLYEDYKAKYSYPEKGDVLISAAGTLGRTVVFDGRPAYFQDSNIVWLKIDKSQLSNDYLAQYYKVIKWASSEGSTISRLYNGIIRDTEILLPPLNEQAAIAKALSDADSLISSLQKLIEKKKAIKRGAMQELLTGKKRLPGFYGEWRTMQIGETLSIGHGQSQKAVENRFGKYPILATSGCIGCANDFLWNKPSVLIGRKGTIDKPQYADYPFWTIDTLFYTKIYDGYDAKFIYYKFCMIDWQQYNEASGVPSLNASTIENLHIVVPEKDEQQAIAQVLSDMDSEIEKLEKKLAKYQQIKQGMMQELLTGRIRLV